MSNILDELKAIENERKPMCSIKAAIDKLDEAERVDMTQIVMSDAFSQPTLANFFKRRNISVSKDALSNHRRKLCKCQHP